MNGTGLAARVVLFLSGTLVLVLTAILTLHAYVSRSGLAGQNFFLSGVLLIVLVTILASLVALNSIYFHAKMKFAYPRLARGLAGAFIVATIFLLIVIPKLRGYALGAKGVVLYFLIAFGISLTLNIVVYLVMRSSRSMRP
jgi:hypothetical protein